MSDARSRLSAAGRHNRQRHEQSVTVVFVPAQGAEQSSRAVDHVDAVALGREMDGGGCAQGHSGFEGRIGVDARRIPVATAAVEHDDRVRARLLLFLDAP